MSGPARREDRRCRHRRRRGWPSGAPPARVDREPPARRWHRPGPRRAPRRPARRAGPRPAAGPPAAAAPTGSPQRWQYRARGDRAAPQWRQSRGLRVAPQALQKTPEAGAPHAGQGAVPDAETGGRSWEWKRTPVETERVGYRWRCRTACAYRWSGPGGRPPPPFPFARVPAMAQQKSRSPGPAERPSLEGFPLDLSGAGKDDLLDPHPPLRGGLPPASVHRHPRRQQERRGPRGQFEKALDGDIMFDGSSIEGFVRIEESDMLLEPDLGTFRILPCGDEGGRVARLICDIYTPDEEPFAGCPRTTLKRQVERARKLGFTMKAGMRGGVLPVREGARRRADRRSPTTRRPTSTWPRWTWARRSGGRSSSSWRRWGSRWRRPTTRWRRASTRSTSGTRTRSPRRTTSPPSGSS